jgi:hypothetical protein
MSFQRLSSSWRLISTINRASALNRTLHSGTVLSFNQTTFARGYAGDVKPFEDPKETDPTALPVHYRPNYEYVYDGKVTESLENLPI